MLRLTLRLKNLGLGHGLRLKWHCAGIRITLSSLYLVRVGVGRTWDSPPPKHPDHCRHQHLTVTPS